MYMIIAKFWSKLWVTFHCLKFPLRNVSQLWQNPSRDLCTRNESDLKQGGLISYKNFTTSNKRNMRSLREFLQRIYRYIKEHSHYSRGLNSHKWIFEKISRYGETDRGSILGRSTRKSSLPEMFWSRTRVIN